jgi:hypothetical protein
MEGIEVWRKSSKSAVKWSEVKCRDVRWKGTVGNLSGVKPNERAVKCSWVKFWWEEVKCRQVYWSGVKCSESLSNWVSNIIRRYTDDMKFAAHMAFSFAIFLHVFGLFYHCIYCCIFCILLFNSVSYVFLLLCVFSSVYCYHRTSPTAHSTRSQLFHDSGR